ncbi:MAG: 50S ribosomal protein L1 [Candidatus Aenigmarchaeota archaeon]|nr:50S ribosomal protein L1 [Candidatus Aenigmarchaeota archaeon]
MKEEIIEKIKELREKSKKRNFVQSFDLIINLKEFDPKKPENKITEDVVLPYGKGKEARVVIFSDTIKNVNAEVLTSSDIEKIAKNKREVRKFVKNTDFFLAEPKLMPIVGKYLGQFLGPRGKMPKIITGNVEKLIEDYKKSVRLRIKDSPVVQCTVGKENMKDEEIAKNIEAVLEALKAKLPKGKQNISEVLLKLTMSKPIKIEVW